MTSCNEIVSIIELGAFNSEEDVRAKLVMKLLEALGYPSECISTEVPVYYNEGRKQPAPKHADVICYSKKTPKPDRRMSFSDEYRDSVLLVVEVKAPTENLEDARTQAEFYMHWTRAPLYCTTNGAALSFFWSKVGVADKSLFINSTTELKDQWPAVFEAFSFEGAKSGKSASIAARDQHRKVFADYCEWVCHSSVTNYYIERTLCGEVPGVSFADSDIMSSDDSLLISGEPGIGKSEFLRNLEATLAHDYLNSEGGRIPVFVSALGWMREFCSIAEAAANVIARVSPGISSDSIAQHPNLFCILVDGLDEARRDRDLLCKELYEFVRRPEARLICTSRFGGDAVVLGVRCLELTGFSEAQVCTLLTQRGIEQPYLVLRQFDASGRNLMSNPLHLSCLARVLKQRGNDAVPKNLAEIYAACIHGMLETKIEPDSISDVSYLEYHLGSYAIEKLVNPESVSLRSYLMKAVSPDEAGRIEARGMVGGLLKRTYYGTDFSHPVLQEYLAAYYASTLDASEIAKLCDEYGRDELLNNFFKILCGCLSNLRKQSTVLDYFERNNLLLYMECLRARFNLSGRMKDGLAKEQVKEIVHQAIESYTDISAKYLVDMKAEMPFWRSLSAVNVPVCAVVDYNPTTTVIHITLKEMREGDEIVQLSLSGDADGPVVVTSEGVAVKLLSLRCSDSPEIHVYRIKDYFGGLDCAREIAISMIRDDIRDFFSNPATILREPVGMRCGFVESALRKSSAYYRATNASGGKFSLRNYTSDAFWSMIAGGQDHLVKVDGFDVPVSVVYCMMKLLEMEGGSDYLQFLPPAPDKPRDSGGWIWEFYTEESVKRWCATALLECEISYRQYVETFMTHLAPFLPAYSAGPLSVRIEVNKGDQEGFRGTDWRICKAPLPVESCEEAAAVLVDGFFSSGHTCDGFAQRSREYAVVAKAMGRKGDYYYEQQMDGASLLNNCTFIRNTVIERVKKEIEELFRL